MYRKLLFRFKQIDLKDCGFVMDWMTDFEAFQEAQEEEHSFVSNLTRTMSLTLDTFYENLRTCGVSAKTGVGFTQLLTKILESVDEYETDYKPVYEKKRQERLAESATGPKPVDHVEEDGHAVPLGLSLQVGTVPRLFVHPLQGLNYFRTHRRTLETAFS